MASFYPTDDLPALKTKIDSRAHDLFKEKPGKAPLRVTTIFKLKSKNNDGREICDSIRGLDIYDVEAMESLRDNTDTTQIFTVSQDRSWTTVNISREDFDGIMSTFNIMPKFWKCMFTFGRKSQENEHQFPRFGRRRSDFQESGDCTHELAYMLRRVELNGRSREHDQEPWSIRQTAVYHKLTSSHTPTTDRKSTFLLVAPSTNVESQFERYLDQSPISHALPWAIHLLLVAESMRGWMDYMSHLEERLKELSDKIVTATVGNDKDKMTTLTDFDINFEDRQELKIVEDFVLDLQVILPNILDAVVGVEKQCRKSIQGAGGSVEAVLDEFEDYIEEAKMLIERSKTLKEKSLSTSQLLSDLLSYEEGLALKALAIETKLESKSMCHLAEKSTKDAAAMKVLTVITLVYLPTTIVANFFSTQFVQTTDAGHMFLTNNTWLLAAISVPLTIFTILLWWGWVYYTEVTPVINPNSPNPVTMQRSNSFRSIVSSKKKRTFNKEDLEPGLGLGISTPRSPTVTFQMDKSRSTFGTWSSDVTAVKVG